MPISCKILGCRSKSGNGQSISFHSVPPGQPERNEWIKAIELHQPFNYNLHTFYVCSLHFNADDISIRGKRKTIIKNRFPSIFRTNDTVDECPTDQNAVEVNNNESEWNPAAYSFEFDDDEQQPPGLEVCYEQQSKTDVVSISKENYEQLIDQSVELMKLKILVQKLKESIAKKCTRVKELNKIISKHKYLFKKAAREKEQNETESEKKEQSKKRKECYERKQLEILECLRFGNSYRKYSPTIRIFCFTLHYYSPKAYDYLRSTFNSNLPAARTLRKWLGSIDNSPGFTQCAFDALKQKVEEAKEKGMNLAVGLIFDEMFIRRHSQWDKAKKEFLGHISAGKPLEYEEFSPLAKDALLLMVSGINQEFKISIGYFLTCGLCSEEKEAILNESLRELNETGIIVASMTSDGFKANIAAYRRLGADFKIDAPFFLNPYKKESKVYVVLDPPHMIKLIRNCMARFHEKGTKLLDINGNEISFHFIKKLIDLQTSSGINLGNKLTKTHAEFKDIKMNVLIAVQTISKSTGASIEFLDVVFGHEDFVNSKGTTQFLCTFDSLFDIMNTKKGHTDDKFKRPICAANIAEIKEKFDRDKEYIKGLTVIDNGKIIPVLNTDSHTPFFGFFYSMISFLGIYHDYVEPQSSGIEEMYTFSISQDHVESTFGCVRQMGGNNCNPTAQQFGAAYRKLLVHNEITSSNHSNCLNDVTKVLVVAAGGKKGSTSFDTDELRMLDGYEFSIGTNDDGLKSSSKAYLASEIEMKVKRKILRKGSKTCSLCLNIFDENEKLNDVFINFLSQKRNILQPCKSTINIIDLVDDVLEKYDSSNISYSSMLGFILNQANNTLSLFESSYFGEEHDHESEFLKLITETYLDAKCDSTSKHVTRWSQKKLLRHHHLKEVHREGQ